MKSMKERMDILEQQFINLRDSLLSDLKKHFAVDNGNLRMVVDAEGTNNIEEYNTMEIMQDKNKTERLKEDMKDFLDKEVDKLYTRLKDDLVNDLRDQIMVEQEVLVWSGLVWSGHENLIYTGINAQNLYILA